MTFSLAAIDRESGMSGIVVSSSSPAVAARCAHVRAGVGAAASQNVTDPRLGPKLLDLIAAGSAPAEAIAAALADEPHTAYRQLTVVDAAGATAAFSGERTLGRHASSEGDGAVAAGNLLADEGVPAAMVEAFGATAGHLGARLVAALAAALEAGGEEGPVRSAGLVIARGVSWPIADLRVDWDENPVVRLAELWEVWEPQLEDYVTRAIDPTQAPRYGVPGDDE
jgi:uncharacterized Ntn-hydrolase superfamily protein